MNDRIKMPVLGWCEWVALPELGVPLLRAKIDTGARTSSLHAEQCEEFERDGELHVRFIVRNRKGRPFECESRVVESRNVRSSTGHEEHRTVIATDCVLHGLHWTIEFTLTDRTPMKFPMLLGRKAMAGRFLVDPEKCYARGKPRRKRK